MMTIKDMEDRSGVSRANLRYYEAEGLLTPQRLKNGYRTYSEADLALLEKIKLLRRLGVSIEELRALQKDGETLPAVLDRRLRELSRERESLERVEQVCEALRAEGASFQALEPEKYLEALDAPAAQEEPIAPPLPEEDRLPVVTNLWRRLAARVLDWTLLLFLIMTLVALSGHNPSRIAEAGLLGQLGMAAALMLLDMICLHFFGATPGKALLGLRITWRDGSRLSFQEGVERYFRMLWGALGLWIPIWSIIQVYRCCQRWSQDEPQPWDEGLAYCAQPFDWRRHLAAPVLAVLAVLTAAEAANGYSQLPPHRGELTVADFAENYNRQTRYMGLNSKLYLDEAGQWREEPDPPGVVSINLGGEWDRRMDYQMEAGALRSVTLDFRAEREGFMLTVPIDTVLTAVSAFVWSREDTPLWVSGRKDFIRDLGDADWSQDFTLRGSGAAVTWQVVENRGFHFSTDDWIFPTDDGDAPDNLLTLRCQIALE